VTSRFITGDSYQVIEQLRSGPWNSPEIWRCSPGIWSSRCYNYYFFK